MSSLQPRPRSRTGTWRKLLEPRLSSSTTRVDEASLLCSYNHTSQSATMSGLSSGLKNWHWRSKNTFTFCKSWFEEALTGLETAKTKVVRVQDVEGDSDLGMRKSKVGRTLSHHKQSRFE